MKKGDKVRYNEESWFILVLNYPEMILISLDGTKTISVFGGYGVEKI